MDTPGAEAARGAAVSSRTDAPRRQAAVSPLRRLSRNVLLVGTVLALVAALGPSWAARAGVVVAVLAAVVACAAAWRELAEARRAHAADMLAASRAAGAVLSEERRHNAAVVDTLTSRAVCSAGEVVRLRSEVGGLTVTVETLQGTVSGLQREVSGLQREVEVLTGQQVVDREVIRAREETVATLQETLRSREAELRELGESESHVRTLPRRVLADHGPGALPSNSPRRSSADAAEENDRAGQLWSVDRSPEVCDLVGEAVALPNYEGERKLA